MDEARKLIIEALIDRKNSVLKDKFTFKNLKKLYVIDMEFISSYLKTLDDTVISPLPKETWVV